MFDSSKKYKRAGVIVILLLLAVFLFTNVNIRSADKYRQDNLNNGYNEAVIETNTGSRFPTETVSRQTAEIDLVESELHSDVNNSEEKSVGADTGYADSADSQKYTVRASDENDTISSGGKEYPFDGQNQTEEVRTEQNSETEEKYISVTIEIRCDRVVSKKAEIKNDGIRNSIPDDGTILKKTVYNVPESADVYTLLATAAADNNISIKANTDKSYVSSINNISQMLLTQQSGWKYSVNGVVPGMAAKDYRLSDGDFVKWFFVLSVYEGE